MTSGFTVARVGSTRDWLRAVSFRQAPGVLETGELNGVRRHAREEDATLLWTVAHELRTPLSGILMNAEMLTSDAGHLTHGEIMQMVRSIQHGAQRLQATVEALLTDATMATGSAQPRLRPVRLSEIVADAILVVEPVLAAKGQRIRYVHRGRDLHIDADRQLLGQAVTNLIDNASKYSSEDAVIDVTISMRGDCTRVTVADRGKGLSPASRRDIFKPFFRTSQARASDVGGLGLGLSIVRSLVEMHGGVVKAENRRGGGSRFWFEVPREASESVPL
jgi:signal transduction histidine kinase